MAASVIAAVLERYDGLAVASTAKAYFDEAPARDASGAAVAAPYVVLKDEGTEPQYDFEENPIEVTTLRFEVYGGSLAEADGISAGIRYNGGSITAGSGMDFASGIAVTGQTLLAMVRDREQRFQEGGRGVSAGTVFRVTIRYRVTMQRTA